MSEGECEEVSVRVRRAKGEGEDKVEERGSVKRWRRWGECIHTWLTCTRSLNETHKVPPGRPQPSSLPTQRGSLEFMKD